MATTAYRHDGGSTAAWLCDVGRRLLWAREIAADNQSQAAKLLGCDQSTMSQYEAGKRLVPLRIALAACQHWGLTLDYLYRGTLTSEVRQDIAVRLAAAHPELVTELPARSRRARAVDQVT